MGALLPYRSTEQEWRLRRRSDIPGATSERRMLVGGGRHQRMPLRGTFLPSPSGMSNDKSFQKPTFRVHPAASQNDEEWTKAEWRT